MHTSGKTNICDQKKQLAETDNISEHDKYLQTCQTEITHRFISRYECEKWTYCDRIEQRIMHSDCDDTYGLWE